MNTTSISATAANGGSGAALSVVLVWLLGEQGLTVPAEVAASLAAIFGVVLHWVTSFIPARSVKAALPLLLASLALTACAIPIATIATIASSAVVGAAGTYAAVEQGKLAARTNNLDGVAAGLNAYCASYGGTAAAINREALKTSLVAAGVEHGSAAQVTSSLAEMRTAICASQASAP